MDLETLFLKYNCDKGRKHSYHLLYDKDFITFKNKPINILEVGVLRGESVKCWIDYFPDANVYVLDTFERISENDIPILQNDRVNWCKSDSTNEIVKDKLKEFNILFDIIIDDGLHTPCANKLTFRNLISFLKDDGIYYVEDFFPMTKMSKKELKTKFLLKESNNWNLEEVFKFLEEFKNYQIEEFDNRNITGHQDSFIYKIKK